MEDTELVQLVSRLRRAFPRHVDLLALFEEVEKRVRVQAKPVIQGNVTSVIQGNVTQTDKPKRSRAADMKRSRARRKEEIDELRRKVAAMG